MLNFRYTAALADGSASILFEGTVKRDDWQPTEYVETEKAAAWAFVRSLLKVGGTWTCSVALAGQVPTSRLIDVIVTDDGTIRADRADDFAETETDLSRDELFERRKIAVETYAHGYMLADYSDGDQARYAGRSLQWGSQAIIRDPFMSAAEAIRAAYQPTPARQGANDGEETTSDELSWAFESGPTPRPT